jgi:hypothetical protein
MAEAAQSTIDELAQLVPLMKAMVAEQKKTNVRLAALTAIEEENGNFLATLGGRAVVGNQRLKNVVRVLSQIRLQAFPPGPIRVEITGEITRGNGMADLTTFDVALPALSDPHDVVKRHVKVSVDGTLISETVAAPGDEKVTGLSGPQGSTAVVTLQDEDDGGNLSEVTTATAVLTDVVAPAAPGELGIAITGEILDGADPAPEPEPEPTPEEPAPEPTPEEPAPEPAPEPTPEEPPIG